jgi:ParB/RepB/Spo0J family partition protein
MTIVVDNPMLEQEIPIERIHADPFQPRLHPDDELADSIKTQGILQAITIEPCQELDAICPDCGKTFIELAAAGDFMINDGERRFRGAIAAKQKTILAKIIPASTESARLLRQLTANTGKPLTPVEEAFSFQRLMQSQDWSQAELARQLGRPRSVVGDRIRLVELDQIWLDLIAEGKLQVSHAPIIHQYRSVPSEYQAKAAKNIFEGDDNWQMRRYKNGDAIPVSEFRKVLNSAFRDFIIRLDQVRSYKGPVLEIEEEQYVYGAGEKLRKVKYAADIKLWRPIKREADKRAKKARESSSGGTFSRYSSPLSTAVKQVQSAGFACPTRKRTKEDIEIFGESNWASGIDPKTLLAKLDPTTLAIADGQYGSRELVTTDQVAVAAARAAYDKRVKEIAKKELAPLRAKLTNEVLAHHAVKGPGVQQLMDYLRPDHGEPKVVALALGLKIAGDLEDDGYYDDEPAPVLAEEADRDDAEKLLSALAAISDLKIKVPDNWSIDNKIRQALGNPVFKVEKASTSAKSKKQQKREARAAGKLVGDPSRATKEQEVAVAHAKDVDVGAMRAAVEAGVETEEFAAV